MGMNLVALTGFVVSVHTTWITFKISEGGNVCSSATVFSCDDVLGNAQYNVDPVFGISWGLIGMFAFGALLFITNSVSKEPDALWAESYLKYGKLMTGAGLLVIALLVSYEVRMGKICQFCTMAHIANVVSLFGFLEGRETARRRPVERLGNIRIPTGKGVNEVNKESIFWLVITFAALSGLGFLLGQSDGSPPFNTADERHALADECVGGHSGLAEHYHPMVVISVLGEDIEVPGNVGLNDPGCTMRPSHARHLGENPR